MFTSSVASRLHDRLPASLGHGIVNKRRGSPIRFGALVMSSVMRVGKCEGWKSEREKETSSDWLWNEQMCDLQRGVSDESMLAVT